MQSDKLNITWQYSLKAHDYGLDCWIKGKDCKGQNKWKDKNIWDDFFGIKKSQKPVFFFGCHQMGRIVSFFHIYAKHIIPSHLLRLEMMDMF